MPLPTAVWLSGPYTPNGTATRFPFDFMALSDSEVRVYVVGADGIEVDLTNYAVEGVLNENGGAVVFTSPPNYPNKLLYVQANPSFAQPIDFQNQGAFNPTDLNVGLDRSALRDVILLAREDVTRAGLAALTNRVIALEGGDPVTGGGGGTVGGAINWNQIVGKPTSFTPSAHTHAQQDVSGLAESFAAKADADLENVDNLAFLNKANLAGVGGAGSGAANIKNLADYGAIDGGGINTANNDAAFAAAEAGPEPWIYVPYGVYRTTRHQGQFRKGYRGPGKIKCSLEGQPTVWDGYVLPANFSWLHADAFDQDTQGVGGWFDNEVEFGEGEYRVIGAGARTFNLDQQYFHPSAIPHHAWFDVNSGHSGLSSRLANGVAAGATSMTLWGDAGGFVVGKEFAFCVDQNAAILSRHTVQTKVGNDITFTPAAPQAYPAGYAVRVGPRTWNGHTYVRVRAQPGAGGDVYGHIVRIDQKYQPWAGQKHWVNTGTVGQYGGDIWFHPGSSGSYATGWESQYNDSISLTEADAQDVAVIAQVDSFTRHNDTGARGVMWLGILLQSSGSKPVDAGFVANGKFRTVLDTTGADLSHFMAPGDNQNIAINMALNQRIAMNSRRLPGTRTADPNGYYYGPMFGSTPGDMFIDSGNDGTSDYFSMWFNRAAPNNGRFRLRPTGAFFNVDLKSTKRLVAGTDLVVGEATNGDAIISFGVAGDYIRFNQPANQFEFYKSYVLVHTI